MTREFTNLTAGEQRAVLYEKNLESNISLVEIVKHLATLNNKVDKNSRKIQRIEIIGMVLFIGFCIIANVGIPYIPGI